MNRPLSEGRCAGRPDLNALFFSPDGQSGPDVVASPYDKAVLSKPARAALAQLRDEMCWPCPARATCLAEYRAEEFGIFGGLTRVERRKLKSIVCDCGAPLDPRQLAGPLPAQICTNCRLSVAS